MGKEEQQKESSGAFWDTGRHDWLKDSEVESSIWWFTVLFYNSLPRPKGVTGWARRRQGGDTHHQWRTKTEMAGQRRKLEHVYNFFIQFCNFFFIQDERPDVFTDCVWRMGSLSEWIWDTVKRDLKPFPYPSRTIPIDHFLVHMSLLPKYTGIRDLDQFLDGVNANNPDSWFSVKLQQ